LSFVHLFLTILWLLLELPANNSCPISTPRLESVADIIFYFPVLFQVQQLEERFRRSIQKSRPYFDEKQICQDQLQTQKERIHQIQGLLQTTKSKYSTSLRSLEQISEEIHRQRGDLSAVAPSGVRQPGVGAEQQLTNLLPEVSVPKIKSMNTKMFSGSLTNLPDFSAELDRCDERQSASGSQCISIATSSAVSEKDPSEGDLNDDLDLEYLRQKVKTLAVRPVESADGQQQDQDIWENELNATVNKLDHLMMMRETASSQSMTPTNNFSLPSTPLKDPTTTPTPVKQLQKVDPLPLANVSMFNVSSISNFSLLPDSWATHKYSSGDYYNNNSRTQQQSHMQQQQPAPQPQLPPFMQIKRKLSLQ
jgi:SH3-domain binding protein 5